MPYIEDRDYIRDRLIKGDATPTTDGELNFLLTTICHTHIQNMGGMCYDNINAVIGVLECAKLEFYRMLAAPYEDEKKATNGNISNLDSGIPNDYS